MAPDPVDHNNDNDLSVEQARQRSREHAEQALEDPEFRAILEAAIERANRTQAPTLTKAEFLAQTADSIEDPPAG